MGNYYKDNEDLRFYVERWIDWDALVRVTEWSGGEDALKDGAEARAFFEDIFSLVGEFSAKEIGAHAEEIDREKVHLNEAGEAELGPRQEQIFEKVKELGLHGLCVPRELGGLNAPLTVLQINNELFARGDVSVAAHHGFHGGMALVALAYSIREGTTKVDLERREIVETRFAEAIEEMISGEAWGCMDITEPDAGSDMAKIRTRGEQDDDGQWYVTGSKIYITSGHGKYHFVIARTEEETDDPASGLGGLSMFLVPTYEDGPDGRTRHVEIVRLEEKLGHNGSATAALAFDRAPAHLIGERGEGFKYMLLLMNNARVGVGFECLGLCESALAMAREYADERRSMGKPISRHEMLADYMLEMQRDIQGIRALAMKAAYHEEMSQKLDMVERFGMSPEEFTGEGAASLSSHKRTARELTPLLKYLGAEKAVEISRRALQIHGGAGYTKDYGAEKLLRDAMVMPIYEGTSQIQALMVMKDQLGGMIKAPQRFVQAMAQARWRSVSAKDPLEKRLARLQFIGWSARQHLLTRTAADKLGALSGEPITSWPDRFLKNWNPKRDFAFAMLHAERLTRILADVAVCEALWEQAREHEDRRVVLEDYLERAEPRARFLLDEITTTGARLLERLAAQREADERDAGAAE